MWIKMWKFCGNVEIEEKLSNGKMYKYTKNSNKNKKIHLFHRSYKHVDNFVNKEVYNKEKYGYN